MQARLQRLSLIGGQQPEQVVAPPTRAEQADEGDGRTGQCFQRVAITLEIVVHDQRGCGGRHFGIVQRIRRRQLDQAISQITRASPAFASFDQQRSPASLSEHGQQTVGFRSGTEQADTWLRLEVELPVRRQPRRRARGCELPFTGAVTRSQTQLSVAGQHQ